MSDIFSAVGYCLFGALLGSVVSLHEINKATEKAALIGAGLQQITTTAASYSTTAPEFKDVRVVRQHVCGSVLIRGRWSAFYAGPATAIEGQDLDDGFFKQYSINCAE